MPEELSCDTEKKKIKKDKKSLDIFKKKSIIFFVDKFYIRCGNAGIGRQARLRI